MTRTKFQEELQLLLNSVRVMGVNLEDTLDRVIVNLEKKDVEVAQEIINGDDKFDSDEVNIEKQCLELVLTQTPVATDWREIASCLKLVGDMERIADHCSDISQYTLKLAEKPAVELPENFMKMLKVMREMVYDSITAISENDVELAQKVMATDDAVDDYFAEMRQQLTTVMMQQPQQVPQYVDYLMIAKYVERIADHATNIAQWVLFVVKNELKN
ncbi:phosphate signaling complex protein PhoU [uncultured Phascolarctobacterium sp.]|mgnify:FL=1|uniref:phosphate signaling complex protein PhoU n=1 Tax=uncultured Phascolarctobacterium sp. TaxID=512296 RepID=UPI0025CE86C6|nr:phosphate signaling complex protein PhoU [uncultured Phascolarctobacterium sp.]